MSGRFVPRGTAVHARAPGYGATDAGVALRPGADAAGGRPDDTVTGQREVADFFGSVPKVDAVGRVPRARFPGLAGWGAWQWAALVAASSLLFVLYGGLGAGLSAWVLVVVAASVLGGFVVASYVPRGGARAAFSPCGLMPLLVTFMVPTVLNPADPMSAVVGLGLLGAFSAQRAMGAGCGV